MSSYDLNVSCCFDILWATACKTIPILAQLKSSLVGKENGAQVDSLMSRNFIPFHTHENPSFVLLFCVSSWWMWHLEWLQSPCNHEVNQPMKELSHQNWKDVKTKWNKTKPWVSDGYPWGLRYPRSNQVWSICPRDVNYKSLYCLSLWLLLIGKSILIECLYL